MGIFDDIEPRRRAAKEWSKKVKDLDYHEDSIICNIQILFREIDKRVAEKWNANERSVVWREYFVAALRKLLRELPATANGPNGMSIAELRTEIQRINRPAEPTAVPDDRTEVSKPASISPTAIPDDNEEVRKPVNTSTASAGPTTNTTFKVDTQGDYKTRVVEDGTTTSVEFLLNGPATVIVQTTVSPTAATGTAAQLGIFSLWKR